jgi:excinuclease UvrABC helicase subunit UvrB
MFDAAKELNFERAAQLRDMLKQDDEEWHRNSLSSP